MVSGIHLKGLWVARDEEGFRVRKRASASVGQCAWVPRQRRDLLHLLSPSHSYSHAHPYVARKPSAIVAVEPTSGSDSRSSVPFYSIPYTPSDAGDAVARELRVAFPSIILVEGRPTATEPAAFPSLFPSLIPPQPPQTSTDQYSKSPCNLTVKWQT